MENQKVSIELEVGAWNLVMNALSQRPFAEVAGVITLIRQQADAQLQTTENIVAQ